jgi:hypothetical protein
MANRIRNRLALEGVQKIDRAPTMSTLNGIGTTLYGRRNFDPQTKSHVATLYFTFVFLPLDTLDGRLVDQYGENEEWQSIFNDL